MHPFGLHVYSTQPPRQCYTTSESRTAALFRIANRRALPRNIVVRCSVMAEKNLKVRYFFVGEDESLNRIAVAKYNRIFNRAQPIALYV